MALSYSRKIILLSIVVLIIKLILLPFAQTVDADAVSRVFISLNWLKHPNWIMQGAWPPFHFYLNGLALSIWPNTIITPKIINIILSTASLLPFFYLTRRLFNEKGAFIATVYLAICPILFRNSFLALSETPYIFFVLLSINLVSKSINDNKISYAIWSGVFMTLAAGFRYEAWILIAVVGLIFLLVRKWKLAFFFGAFAMLFPIAWMISNHIATGDFLDGIHGNYKWTLEMMGTNDNIKFANILKRIWFFPFSWIIAVGIPVAFYIIKEISGKLKNKESRRKFFILTLPLFIMFAFTLYNSLKGVLLLQHRFIGTITILSLPFIALYFEDMNTKKTRNALIFGALTVIFSFGYNTSNVKPVPRLKYQSTVEIVKKINQLEQKTENLIIDFVGWEDSYYIALQSRLNQDNIVIIQGAKNSSVPLERINKTISSKPYGVIVLNHDSDLNDYINSNKNAFEDKQIVFSTIAENNRMKVCTWQKN